MLNSWIEEWSALNINDRFSLLGSISTILGVIIVIWQVFLAVDAIEDNAQNHLSGSLQEINKVFIDDPDLWKYFEQGKEVNQEDKIYPKVMAVADMHLDFLEVLWVQADNIGELESEEGWESWDGWIHSLAKNAPAFCSRLSKTESWYDPNLVKYLNKKCIKSEAE